MLKLLLTATILLLALAAPGQPSPPADWAGLGRYAAANRRLLAPRAERPRVVLMGNSITERWPQIDSAFFARRGPYELIGRGISGQVSAQMLVRFRQDVLRLNPEVVVILAGTNDIAENQGPYNLVATMNNIKSMADLAEAHAIRVVLCSVLPATKFSWRRVRGAPALKIVALNAQIRAYARQQRYVYLDYHAALANVQQGLPRKYSADGVHPNRAGYRVMEPLLEEALREALR